MNETRDAGRGREADAPRKIPAAGWKDILWRVKDEYSDDRVSLVAAGITFFMFLAMFPAIAAFVSIYGLVADPATIASHLDALAGVLPTGVIDVVREQVTRIVEQTDTTLGFALLVSLALAIWSANKGTLALFEGLNVAYDEHEERGFIKRYLTSLLFTAGGLVAILTLMAAIGVVPAAINSLGLGPVGKLLVAVLPWVAIAALGVVGLAAIYRYGPSRSRPRWQWVSWGSVTTLILVLAASLLFSWYLSNFANYNETYGSLGALIGLLMWMWIMVLLVLIGGELNSEIEHQTRKDTTTGAPEPMGERGATMADTLGERAD